MIEEIVKLIDTQYPLSGESKKILKNSLKNQILYLDNPNPSLPVIIGRALSEIDKLGIKMKAVELDMDTKSYMISIRGESELFPPSVDVEMMEISKLIEEFILFIENKEIIEIFSIQQMPKDGNNIKLIVRGNIS
jgi:hypothetical protein